MREQRARATCKRILTAARTEFLRSGYAATTMRAIAATTGVSVATVELVFGTKPSLLQAAISFSIRGDAEPVPMRLLLAQTDPTAAVTRDRPDAPSQRATGTRKPRRPTS